MVANSNWQEHEKAYLIANYGKSDKATLLQNLKHRTWQSIRAQAKRLKLGKPRITWTLKEIKTLETIFPLTPKQKVLKMLPNRSWESIVRIASEKQIHRMRSLEYNKGKLQQRTISQFELGYIAGLFDGEGSINIHHNKNTFSMKAEIANTFSSLEHYVQELFGGKITYSKQRGRSKASWNIYHSSAVAILETLRELQPFLRVKGTQGLLMIEFCERRIKFPQGFYDNRDFEIATKICEMNGKKPVRKEAM